MTDEVFLDLLVATTALTIGVWLAGGVARRSPAALRHTLWRIALGGFWLVPGVLAVVALLHVQPYVVDVPVLVQRPEVESAAMMREDREQVGFVVSPGPPEDFVASAPVGSVRPAASSSPTVPPPGSPSATSPISPGVSSSVYPMSEQLTRPQERGVAGLPWGLGELLIGVWLVGALVGLAAFVRDLLAVRRLLHQAVPLADSRLLQHIAYWSAQIGLRQPPEALETRAVALPSVVGWQKPRLLLPIGLSQIGGHVDAAIVHELAHTSRRDVAAQVAAQLTRALWWWNPLMWLVARELRATAEEACDDWVVALTGSRREYAETLVEWAEAAQVVGLLGCASRGRALVKRVQRILEQKRRPRVRLSWQASGVLAVCAAVALLAVGGVRLRAAGANAEEAGLHTDQARTVTGTVVGADGRPVGGAQVWLLQTIYDEKTGERSVVVAGSARSSTDGRFSFGNVDLHLDKSRWQRPRVLCYSPGLALGWQPAEKPGEQLEIRLEPPKPMHGTILAVSGSPIAGARVELTHASLQVPEAHGVSTHVPLAVPKALRSIFHATTDVAGTFDFNFLPAGASASFDIAIGEYVTIHAWRDGVAGPLKLTLGEATSLSGNVICPDAKEAAGRRLRLTGSVSGSARRGEGWRYHIRESTLSDESGYFTFAGVPPGEYTVYVSMGNTGKWQPKGRATLTIEPGGGAVNLDIALEQAWPIVGRVVHAKTREPVPDVYVRVYSSDRGQEMAGRTHENGRFLLYALPGRISVSFRAPEGYTRAGSTEQFLIVSAGQQASVPDFMLKPGVPVYGVVVDEQGQPVAGADVWEEGRDRWWTGPRTTSDQYGKFEIPNLPPNAPLTLYATFQDMVTAEVTEIITGRQDGPARLVLSGKAGAYLRGSVVDQRGKAVPGAEVSIDRYIQHWRGRHAKPETDKAGRFESPVLIPGYRYTVSVRTDGYSRSQKQEWTAEAGQIHDFGDIVIVSAQAILAGVVVDTSGKPLADVTVFNSGDGPQRVSAVSDERGRFALGNLHEGYAYAFAEAPGYRFAGIRSKTGSKNVKIVLRSADEPRAHTAAHPPVFDLEKDRKLAERVALEALDMTRDTKYRFRGRLIGALVRANPTKGLQVWEQEGRIDADRVWYELGLSIVEANPQEALVHLAKIEDISWRAQALKEAGAKLGSGRREFAAEALRESVETADLIQDKGRATMRIAQAAREMDRLGMQEGRRLLQESYGRAKGLSYGERDSMYRGYVAESICMLHLPSALSLVEGIPDDRGSSLDRHMSNIAYLVAAENPDGAENILARVRSEFIRERASARVAYAMASKDAQRALKLARGIEDRRRRALALGNVAMAIAPRDSEPAAALIEEAVSVEASAARPYFDGHASPAIVVAHLAKIALDIGYPDMEALVMRAMSLRMTEDWVFSDMMRLQDAPLLAAHLAWVDTEAARHVLQSLSPETAAQASDQSGRFSDMLYAAMIIDPEWALDIAGNRPPDDPEYPQSRYLTKAGAYYRCADFLSGSPEERVRTTISRQFWIPGPDSR